ncbi:viral A-type inclusion protein [Reticulomyxa filosa]|uniref:Viral A-type inclusion protein n=1 Tax=Reticulomyxa filosa TaxID=46433 RepID=X6NXL8_RETFI|nr:viral A-type inclusion protein [Reticulomyxa filosa]|eukprot:ETO30628.1 viral A-type inclusion protein [Reticulomyxa filosa]
MNSEKHRNKFSELKSAASTPDGQDRAEFMSWTDPAPSSLEPNNLYEMFIEVKTTLQTTGSVLPLIKHCIDLCACQLTRDKKRVSPSAGKKQANEVKLIKTKSGPSSFNTSQSMDSVKEEESGTPIDNETTIVAPPTFHERYMSVKEFLEEDIVPPLSQLKNNNAQLRAQNDQLSVELDEVRKEYEKLTVTTENLKEELLHRDEAEVSQHLFLNIFLIVTPPPPPFLIPIFRKNIKNGLRQKNRDLESKLQKMKPLADENQALRDENAKLQETIRLLKGEMKQNISQKSNQSTHSLIKQEDLIKEIDSLKKENAKLRQQLESQQGKDTTRKPETGLSQIEESEDEEISRMRNELATMKKAMTVIDHVNTLRQEREEAPGATRRKTMSIFQKIKYIFLLQSKYAISQKSARQCMKCQEIIDGRAFKSASGALYHRKCFTCDMCKKLLIGINYSTVKKSNGTTIQCCVTCAEKQNNLDVTSAEQENKKVERHTNKIWKSSSRSLLSQKRPSQSSNGEDNDTNSKLCARCKETIDGKGVQTPSGELFHLDYEIYNVFVFKHSLLFLRIFVCKYRVPLAEKAYGLVPVGNTRKRLCGDCMDKLANSQLKLS